MPQIPAAVETALAASIFANTPRAACADLLANGLLVRIPTGMRVGDTEDELRVLLVLSGRFRMYYTDESGKQLTVRYIGAGEFMGLVAAVGGHFPLEVEALEEASGWVIPGEQVRTVAARHPELAWAIAEECARRLAAMFGELTAVAFGSIRERLIRHLLRFAGESAEAFGEVRASQQELADAVGTSREVIARALRDLRSEGLVTSNSSKLQIPDRERLRAALPEL